MTECFFQNVRRVEKRMQPKNIVIVLSTPRSGTTWLGNILRAHPNICAMKDDTSILYLLHFLKSMNPLSDDSIHNHNGMGGDTHRVLFTKKYYFRFVEGNQILALIAPSNVQFLPLLEQAFPAAKYIHLCRNPLDTIASFEKFLDSRKSVSERYKHMKKWGFKQVVKSILSHLYHKWRWLRFPYPGYLGARPENFQNKVNLPLREFLVWYLCDIEEEIQLFLNTIPGSRKYSLSYENLVMQYEKEISSVLTFMGAEVLKSHLNQTKAWVNDSSINRSLTDFDTVKINELVNLLAKYKHPNYIKTSKDNLS